MLIQVPRAYLTKVSQPALEGQAGVVPVAGATDHSFAEQLVRIIIFINLRCVVGCFTALSCLIFIRSFF